MSYMLVCNMMYAYETAKWKQRKINTPLVMHDDERKSFHWVKGRKTGKVFTINFLRLCLNTEKIYNSLKQDNIGFLACTFKPIIFSRIRDLSRFFRMREKKRGMHFDCRMTAGTTARRLRFTFFTYKQNAEMIYLYLKSVHFCTWTHASRSLCLGKQQSQQQDRYLEYDK